MKISEQDADALRGEVLLAFPDISNAGVTLKDAAIRDNWGGCLPGWPDDIVNSWRKLTPELLKFVASYLFWYECEELKVLLPAFLFHAISDMEAGTGSFTSPSSVLIEEIPGWRQKPEYRDGLSPEQWSILDKVYKTALEFPHFEYDRP